MKNFLIGIYILVVLLISAFAKAAEQNVKSAVTGILPQVSSN